PPRLSPPYPERHCAVRADRSAAPQPGAQRIEAALALWRGYAFCDFLDQDALQVERARLDELRLGAVEELMSARLAIGQHVHVAAELERLTREHPYREEFRALQMLALYRSGRQADALRAFRATRATLADDLGIDPSSRVRRLQEQILLQDPELDLGANAASTAHAHNGLIDNPYLGLRAFREEDHSRFFGRDDLIAELFARITEKYPLTAVVGPSGSGKSSAVSAGLIPRVRHEIEGALVVRMQPGAQPIAELDTAIEQAVGRWDPITSGDTPDSIGQRFADALPAYTPFVLVVDQFEELYTMVEFGERERFLAAIRALVDHAWQQLRLVLTIRADFYDRPLAEPEFGAIFAKNVVNVLPSTPDELEAAALGPARQVDVTFEPRLIARLLHDVIGQPNALPIFQYALTEMFDERDGAVLELATYERIGGVRRAIAQRAERLYSRFDAAEQEATRQLMLRLSAISHDFVGRRRVPAPELVSLDVDDVALQGVIDAFSRHRLLSLDRDPATNEPTIEVAHEALLQEWDRLAQWIAGDREDLETHSSYLIAVGEWERAGRDTGYLLTGTRLDDYVQWADTTRLRLTAVEREFIDSSVAERDAVGDPATLRRRTRLQVGLLALVVCLLAGVVVYPILTRTDRDTVVVALDATRRATPITELLARGFDQIAAQGEVDAVLLEPPFSADLGTTLGEIAGGDPQLVILGGALITETAPQYADSYPDTTFAAFDGRAADAAENVAVVNFAVEQAGYLAGAAAALESETGVIGYIGANRSPEVEVYRAGFEQGARAVDPTIEIIPRIVVDYTSSLAFDADFRAEPSAGPGSAGYGNPSIVRAVAGDLFTTHDVDVVFTAAGQSSLGAVEAAAELSDDDHQLWTIGLDNDDFFDVEPDARDHVLTSVLKRLDAGVETIVERFLEDGVLPPVTTLTLADGAVGYATSGDHLDAETIRVLDRLERSIALGYVVVASSPAEDIPVDATTEFDLSIDQPDLPIGEVTTSSNVNDRVKSALEALEELDEQG
ncbi:MAG: BTAD domain-containing putative transcriptional regulator, partial [Actinomycetota bacterium]